jgi:colanic acid biosynthesis glycosyl transferase WcaI
VRILLVNQAFHPDVVSSGQHLTDLALALVREHSVTVLTSATGYDDPTRRYPSSEVWNGIEIKRIKSPRWSKRSKFTRALDFLGFLAVAAARLVVMPRADVVLAMTSPPLVSVLAAALVRLRGGRLVLWLMDLNPDESVAAGWLREDAWITRVLQRCLRFSLRSAETVVALDRFMAARVRAKGIPESAIHVIAPWSHDDVRFDQNGRERFRIAHGLAGKYVVMYAGNHSPCHPLTTLLEAARALRDDPSIAFCFVGGGSAAPDVQAFASRYALANIVRVSYQSREALPGAISAGDLHVVALGDPFVGTVHPCKVYNLLRIGAPVLYIGPPESHMTDIANRLPDGQVRSVRHGDVEGAVRIIREQQTRAVGSRLKLDAPFSAEVLIPAFVSLFASPERRAMAHSAAIQQVKRGVTQ